MLRNYFKVALRNILKYKFFSAINILGMTIGIVSCLLLVLYVADELSFDRFHKNADRLYQLGLHGKLAGQDIRTATTAPPIAATLVAEIPEIEAATRLANFNETTVRYEDKTFLEKRFMVADSNFFEFFTFRLLEGDAKTCLREPNAIVLTEDMATKYFGNSPALGKLLAIGNDNKTYKVSGVTGNVPTNSHFTFDALISASSRDDMKTTVWLNNYMYTYFMLRENTQIETVNAKYLALVEKYIGPELEKFMGITLKQMRDQGGEFGYYSTALPDLHLHSNSNDNLEAGGNIMYVYFFMGIGAFIIAIACINFMNLSTARSAGRAKEVGLRKTLGSLRSQLVGQFLAESVIYSLVAVVLALVASYFLLPYFNLLSGKELTLQAFTQPWFIGGIVALIVFVGIIAGSYPAFYLTSFNAVEVLKGKVRSGMKSRGVRSFLVIFQFALSIFLIIFTVVVYQQITYMQDKNLGIDKNNVLVLRNTWRLGNNKEAFRNALGQQTGVAKVSYTNNNFPGVNSTTIFKAAGDEQDHIMGLYYADFDHKDVLRFDMKEGRYFSKDYPSDSLGIIINEAAAKEFGYTQSALDQEILYNDDNVMKRLKVVGVMKNFNFESFKTQVRPLAILLTKNSGNLLVRYEGSPKEVVARIEQLWKQQGPNEPFEYTFMDDNFDSLFRSEQRMAKLFSVFSGLAIFIACLGLFALAAFTAEQRTKEIGIRKAMGASSTGLVLLLSKEFTRLVIVAFVPAAAVGWYVSDHWLQSFAYRIDVDPMVIVFSGLASISIAWLTVGYQAIKAAASDPVKALRYE